MEKRAFALLFDSAASSLSKEVSIIQTDQWQLSLSMLSDISVAILSRREPRFFCAVLLLSVFQVYVPGRFCSTRSRNRKRAEWRTLMFQWGLDGYSYALWHVSHFLNNSLQIEQCVEVTLGFNCNTRNLRCGTHLRLSHIPRIEDIAVESSVTLLCFTLFLIQPSFN